MVIRDQRQLQEENQRLRTKLVDFGIRPESRFAGETVQKENRRLREVLRWYVGLLKSNGPG